MNGPSEDGYRVAPCYATISVIGALKKWVGGDRANLALVFTDIVDSTKLADELKSYRMKAVGSGRLVSRTRLVHLI